MRCVLGGCWRAANPLLPGLEDSHTGNMADGKELFCGETEAGSYAFGMSVSWAVFFPPLDVAMPFCGSPVFWITLVAGGWCLPHMQSNL